jgi:glutamate--cysteine ligase
MGRLRLRQVQAVLASVAAPRGRFTVEPGGQVEHATAVHPTAAGAVGELERGWARLAHAFGPWGVALASAGMDVWHDPSTVPQQLAEPRYLAMAAYLAQRGPQGHTMMCHTCSLQVNLDLGPPDVAADRWLVANLAAPIVKATFACSPVPGAVCGRALAWLVLDPTRTGVPRLLTAGVIDPVTQLVDFALSADVLLIRTPDGGAVPGRPGWTFGDWLRDGHPEHGRPSSADLTYHLTTLFPEVRARGFLELRSADALPSRWRSVPVTLLTGLLYDDRARANVGRVLQRHRRRLPALLKRAATIGVADPELCALTVETWSLALAGAYRLSGYFRPGDLGRAEAFLDRFTLRGRCPADELRERLALSPAAALAWATEPVEELSLR